VASASFALITLGELRLTGPAGSLLSGRRKELVLLTYLARRSPKPVSREELAALLWGERDDDKARQSLRHALHQLRRSLGDAVDATTDHVRVPEDAVAVDATVLERDVAAGRLVDAAERYGGDFLLGADDVGGEEYTSWLEREREGLRRTAAGGLSRLVAESTAAGDCAAETRWARRWVELFPHDESAHLRLIEALQRDGKADEARAVHASFVTTLKTELDLPPSVELIRLGEELSKSTRQERERRPGSGAIVAPQLVGRGAAVATSLYEIWSQVRAQGGVAIVEGERGTGRTRLASELARRIRGADAQATVLETRAEESDASTPWSTLRRLMAGLIKSPAIEDAPNKALVELSELLPDLRARFPQLAQPSGSIERSEAAFKDLLRVIASKIPLALSIDDYERADAQTHQLLRQLSNAMPRGVMLLITLDAEHSVGAAWASELGEVAGVRRFKLAALTASDMASMVDSILEVAPTDRSVLVDRLFRESGGNPQRITALVSKYTGSGELSLSSRGVWQLTTRPVATSTAVPAPTSTAFQRRPRVHRAWIVAAMALVAVIAGGIPLVRALASSSNPDVVDQPAPRVAVLDLEASREDTADTYLASGLAEEINSTLSRFEELRIKSRGSVRTARAAGVIDPVKLGQSLGVDYLVEGSLRHVGKGIVVAVRLTKTSDGFQLWSKDFTVETSALPALHQQIASEVASRIGGRLTRGELAFARKPPTADARAYEHYLRGNYYLNRRTPPTVEQAISQYQLAMARDSLFVGARARIAYSYALLADWGWTHAHKSPEQLLHEGLALADHALSLDSLSADAWMAKAYLLESADPVWMSGAAEAFQRAINLDPRNSEAVYQQAQVYEATGNWDLAVPALRRAAQLEPDRSLPYVAMASIAWKRGSPAEARRLYDTALVISPGASYTLSARALLRLYLGDAKGGLSDAETAVHVEDGYSIPPHAVLAIALAKNGEKVRAGLEVDRALSEVPDPAAPSPTDARFIASGLIAVGRKQEAVNVIERAQPRGAWLWFYTLAPDYDPVRSDPRFVRVMQEAHPPRGPAEKR
jgi:DNA-binding SARP family transcriptional activator/TolB-like protein